jgi:hypothetical protein
MSYSSKLKGNINLNKTCNKLQQIECQQQFELDL